MSGNGLTRMVVRRRASVGAACAAALLLGVAVGVTARTLSGPDDPAPPVATRVVGVGPARLEVPRAWQTLRAGPTRVLLAPAPPLPDQVLVTVEPADRRSLVGPSLRARVNELPLRPRTVDVAGQAAWQYTGLVNRRGTEALDVTVLPARDAVVNVACISPIRDAGSMPDCAGAIRSVAVGGSPTLVPAEDLALQLRLPRVLARLDRARREGRTALGHAQRPSTQQALARRLAQAHTRAADAVRPVAGAAGDPLLRRLSATADAYQALARAIGASSASRLRAARRAVRASDARVVAVVESVVRYPLRESTVAAPARTPAPANTTPGWRWPFIVLSLVLAFVLALCALRWRAAPAGPARQPEAPQPPPVEPRPVPVRWDAPPSSLVTPPEQAVNGARRDRPAAGARP